MYFGLSEDQIFFQENVSKFLEDQSNLDVIRKITEGEANEIQQEIHYGLVNLGLSSLLIPEQYGGLGLDLLFATAVSQSLGEGLGPIPFAGSYIMAPLAIMLGGNQEQKNKGNICWIIWGFPNQQKNKKSSEKIRNKYKRETKGDEQ